MGEIKSVKVDNWGVFFLQKLQNFFNKTDYCDLTLQFRDNSQLKVHRLVLSACTDYFNVLEHTCEVIDDALIMPNELQADVVVPIVNFMYTGTLEFELKMYGKLLRTAREMNMTVLLKLLEAHRRTMEGVNRAQRPPSPKTIRRRGPIPAGTAAGTTTQHQQTIHQTQRRVVASPNAQTAAPQQRRVIHQTKQTATNTAQTQGRQAGAPTLLRATGSAPTSSSPSILQQFKHESTQQQQSPSTFEQLRKGYNNNKRPANVNFITPPAKKPNIEDVKEFAEQQRMRKQIAAEYGDDHEYEGMMDDDIHNDDDDDDAMGSNSFNASASSANSVRAQQQQHQQQQQQQHQQQQQQQQPQVGETTITFKHDQSDKPPTIVVKDSSNSKMNHAKIISEVLRQYPHLAKGNKNIKLKIMPNTGGQAQKIIVKREHLENVAAAEQQPQQVLSQKPHITSQTVLKPVEKASPPQAQQQQHQIVVGNKTPVEQLQEPTDSSSPTPSTSSANAAKRRIDSKTMHALIALGAENTTGPWLCLRCGVSGRPISIPTYRGFRRHLINTHKETIDPAICEHCGWRSTSNRELHFHIQVEHKIRTTLYTYPECLLCAELFLDTNALNQHMLNSHPNTNKQQCIYCNKIFGQESQLFAHMKAYHKRQALDDGIIDYSDEEFVASHDEAEMESHHAFPQKKKESKVKILSDISLPSTSSLIKLDPSSEAAALSTVASGIATSIGISAGVGVGGAEEFIHAVENEGGDAGGSVTKFVNADGNEMVLTDELRKEIMSQLNQEHDGGPGGVVMVLNESTYATEESTSETNTAGTEDQEMQESVTQEEHDEMAAIQGEDVGEEQASADEEYDDSQIYGEFISQGTDSSAKKDTSANLDESKESVDNMEWAENLLSAHDMAEEAAQAAPTKTASEDTAKKNDDISKKLKELTGDWTDDENDEEEDDRAEEGVAETEVDADAEADDHDVDEDVEEDEDEMEQDEEDDEEDEKTTAKTRATTADSSLGENKEEADDVAALSGDAEKPSQLEEELTNKADESLEMSEHDHEESIVEEDELDLAMQNLHKEDSDVNSKNSEILPLPANEISAENAVESTVELTKSDKVESSVTEAAAEETEVKEEKPVEIKADEPGYELNEFIHADVEEKADTNINIKSEQTDVPTENVPTEVNEADAKTEPTNDAVIVAGIAILEEFISEKEMPIMNMDEKVEPMAGELKEDAEPADEMGGQVPKEEAEEATGKELSGETMKEEDKEATAEQIEQMGVDISPEEHEVKSIVKDAATAEKVKSLISEWADDDDDDNEEAEGGGGGGGGGGVEHL